MTQTRSARFDLLILAALSFVLVLYHILTSAFSGYGYFIDEFYYIACSKHLAFGYVDHPPLSIFILAVSRWVLGNSLAAIRLFPALAIGTTAFLAGIIARRLGGSCIAMMIAALAVVVMPVYLLMGSFYSMNAFEPLIWTTILYLVIRLVQEDNARYWLAIGLLMGIGLETKHTMVLYGVALIAGMLVTGTRRYVWNRWFLWGMVSCVLLLLPNLIWQYLHGYPSLEFYRNAMVNKNIPTPPLNVLLAQVMFSNPFALPLWIAGLGYIFFAPDGSRYRFLAWTYILLLGVMLVSGSSRPDRIAAMYVFLFAAGAVTVDKLRNPSARRAAVKLTMTLLIIGGTVFFPVFTPLLPPPVLKNYLSTLGLSFDIEIGKRNEALPQWLADRLGWRELAADVGEVYHALSAGEQQNAVIISTNYGEAGALELYGSEFSLPPVFATHNSYHSWGPPADSVKTFIAVFVSWRHLEGKFDSVVEASVHTCEFCTRPQQRIPIYVARGPRFSMAAEWPKFKSYD